MPYIAGSAVSSVYPNGSPASTSVTLRARYPNQSIYIAVGKNVNTENSITISDTLGTTYTVCGSPGGEGDGYPAVFWYRADAVAVGTHVITVSSADGGNPISLCVVALLISGMSTSSGITLDPSGAQYTNSGTSAVTGINLNSHNATQQASSLSLGAYMLWNETSLPSSAPPLQYWFTSASNATYGEYIGLLVVAVVSGATNTNYTWNLSPASYIALGVIWVLNGPIGLAPGGGGSTFGMGEELSESLEEEDPTRVLMGTEEFARGLS